MIMQSIDEDDTLHHHRRHHYRKVYILKHEESDFVLFSNIGTYIRVLDGTRGN